jgi:hypothetical protein
LGFLFVCFVCFLLVFVFLNERGAGGADNFIAGNCFMLINNVPHFALYRIK